MRKVLRGYAKERDGNLILIGTIPAPHSKDLALAPLVERTMQKNDMLKFQRLT
jgi:hypothetical protein